MKILFHACCAPCAASCINGLDSKEITMDLFWYNHNIHPYTEYQSRRESLITLANNLKIELTIKDEYGLREFLGSLDINEKAQTRCAVCYRTRLERTALAAKERGYKAFSTTLLTSPYQNHELLKQTGEDCASKFSIEFFYKDFRPWFREGREKAKKSGSYMQKYCGCIFSEEERYLEK